MNQSKKSISILGSTGSIGRQALEVIAAYPERFRVIGLASRNNVKLLEEQIKKFRPRLAAVFDNSAAANLRQSLSGVDTAVYSEKEGLRKIGQSSDLDLLLVAIPGMAGLEPTLEAISRGKDIALASKEILVSAGDLVMTEAKRRRINILPVDSEHSAVFQCLRGEDYQKVKKLILTASGGPFLNIPASQLSSITPQQALAHPTWQMGSKVTIDSATLMNKGLEVIEAHHLFGLDFSQIEVRIHPQSIVHALVEFVDGSLKAQLSYPDMRLPIQYALTFPERWEASWRKLEELENLTFREPDRIRFPCLELAYTAGRRGGTLPAVMNAANEVAVELFLKETLPFDRIPVLIEKVMEKHRTVDKPSLGDIMLADGWAREIARGVELVRS